MYTESKPKKFTYFVGIDVSRNELDFAIMRGKQFLYHKEITNDTKAIDALIIELKALPSFVMTKCVFCMENTGFYSNHLIASLKKVKTNIVIENAVKIKNSLGIIRGKYDKIDSIRIAQYAYINREGLVLWIDKRPIVHQLANLSTLRNRLTSIQVALKTPVEEQKAFVKKGISKASFDGCKRTADAIKTDLVELENSIRELLYSDERLKRLHDIIISVPSVGFITAVQIIICTNEFRNINNPKKFACYAGVAPFKRESGLMKGKARISKIANRKIKSLLHICSLSAIRFDSTLKEYFIRKTQGEGKAKMSVLNAVRYKLITRIFTCVNQDRLYEKEYVRVYEIKAS